MHSFKLTDYEVTSAFKQVKFEPTSLGAFTLCRTYLRPIFENGEFVRNETFQEMMTRVVNGMYSMIKDRLGEEWNDDEWRPMAIETLINFANFKVLPPGRGLWACGSKAPKLALYNCSFYSSNYMEAGVGKYFKDIMNALMCGIGVGFDDRGADKYKLVNPYGKTPLSENIAELIPEMSTSDGNRLYGSYEYRYYQRMNQETKIHIVEDNRNGWTNAVEILIDSYTDNGNGPVLFDYSVVRKKGLPLKNFGGKSSGPGPLLECISSIREILDREVEKGSKYFGKKIIIDIANIIGKAVVAGNVRRSSQIALSEDPHICDIKDWTKSENAYRLGWAWSSNNSYVVTEEDMNNMESYAELIETISEKINLNGEPGLFYLPNVQKFSRTGFPPDNKDSNAIGTNPCGEISLEGAEVCNIAETFLSNIDSTDPYEVARYVRHITLYCCIVSCQETGWKEVDIIKERNNRIGVGLTGVSQFINKHNIDFDELKNFLCTLYDEVQVQVDSWCKLFKMNRCIKTTTIKPSGTVSLLGNTTPGMHMEHSDYYMRTVRYNIEDDHFTKVFKENGYRVERDVMNPTTTNVVYFPVKAETIGGITKDNVSIEYQMKLAAWLQKYWSDNQVSCTVSYWDHESHEIKYCLLKYMNVYKGISFLKNGKKGEKKSHKQMPYESISESTYDLETSQLKKILSYEDFIVDKKLARRETSVLMHCDGEKCELVRN